MQSGPVSPPATYEQVAGMIDHTLLDPALTSTQAIDGLQLAKRCQVAAAVVRPCDIDAAVRVLDGSPVKPASVAGFPHGSHNTAVKLFEARDLLRRGAREIDAVIAISRLISREFQYVQTELAQLAEACHKEGAILKVILENAYLTGELKIVACRTAERAGADAVSTSTGFAPAGFALEDIRLMRRHVPETMAVKAAVVRSLDDLLAARVAGAARIGTSATEAILNEWKARLEACAG